MDRLILVVLSMAVLGAASVEDRPCVPLKFTHDSVVCVCNATYCDTVPEIPPPASDGATVVTSSRDGQRFAVSSAQWTTESRADNRLTPTRIEIFTSTRRQQVFGFGGAVTDAAGINIARLPAAAQDHLLESYYGPSGIRYTVARVPIGGCDFSTRPYTYADEADSSLANFSLTREDEDYKLPYLRRALNLTAGAVRVYASPWSAPAWMKSNNKLTGAGQLKKEYYQTWADYFLKFLEAYDAAGVPMWGLTAQNEPLDGWIPGFTFNCMGWRAETQGAWIRDHLGPTLRRSRYNATKLMILDDQRVMLPAWPDNLLADAETAGYVDGIAVHWYADDFIPASVLTTTHEHHPDKFLLSTEACEGSLPWQLEKVALGSWRRAETYATDIIRDLNHWVTGWVDWNIALDMNGGPNWVANFVDSPVIVDAELHRFYKQPMFYALGHFARFMPPDSTVLGVGETDQGDVLTVAALTPDGLLVATLLNKAEHETEVTVSDPARGHLDLTLPAKSLTTVQWLYKPA